MAVADSKAVFIPNINNPVMMQAFTALSGTDNVRPFGQMLAQNHTPLGNKRFQKISVYGNGMGNPDENDVVSIRGPDIVIQIG